MKSYLPLLFLVFTHLLIAQTYTEVTPPPPFSDINSSSIAWADVDKDGDPDLVVTGKDPKLRGSENRITRLYTNNGDGTFSEATNTPFTGVDHSAIAFTDLNQDGKPDLLITGQTNDESLIAKLYLNTGGSSFEEALNIPFEGVYHSALAVGDLDGSSGPDVLITGFSSNGVRIAKLYLNNGDGTFAKSSATPFEATRDGSVDFADIDNDNDLDVLITGFGSSGSSIARLYTNDGNATFQQVPNPGLTGVHNSAAAFADVNDDDKPDLFITGNPGPTGSISKLYINDGNGGFTETTESTFEGIRNGAVAFFDPDKDGDQDLLIAGVQIPDRDNAAFKAHYYANDGQGVFTEVTDIPFEGVNNSSIAFEDVNLDGQIDVLITGRNPTRADIKILRLFLGNPDEESEPEPMFKGMSNGSVHFADVDNDQDLDVLLTGAGNDNDLHTYLYINDGEANFKLDTRSDFKPMYGDGVGFADVDKDGDLDLLMSGSTPNPIFFDNAVKFTTDLYLNDGSGKFTRDTDASFDAAGRAAIADLDNDGDPDIIISGETIANYYNAPRIYVNDGQGGFSRVPGNAFAPLHNGSIHIVDFDSDQKKDLLINGSVGNGTHSTLLFTNEGDMKFQERTDLDLPGTYSGQAVPADVDQDGDLDILIMGSVGVAEPLISLQIRKSDGTYTEDTQNSFTDINEGPIAFSDIDGDSDLDLLMVGHVGSLGTRAILYRNMGDGIFSEVIGTPMPGVWGGAVAFADVDNDGDNDLLLSGHLEEVFSKVTILYLNTGDGTFYEKK